MAAWGVAVDRANGHAVVLSQSIDRRGHLGGYVGVLDVVSGRVVHRVAVSQMPRDLALDEQRGRAFVSGDSMFVGGDSMSVVDTRRGLLLGTIRAGTAPTSLGVDEQTGHVFMAAGTGAGVSMFDAGTGHLVHPVGEDPHSGTAVPSPLDSQAGAPDAGYGPASMLYLVAGDSEPSMVAVAPRSGRVFVVRGGTRYVDGSWAGGSVLVLDAHSGTVLHTLPVGGDPVAVAVDERAGRVVVVTEGGVLSVRESWWDPWMRAIQRWLPRQSGLTLPGGTPQDAAHTTPGSVSVLDLSRP